MEELIKLFKLCKINNGIYDYKRKKELNNDSLWYQYYFDQEKIESCIIKKNDDIITIESVIYNQNIPYPFSWSVETQNKQELNMDSNFNSYGVNIYKHLEIAGLR